MSFSSDLATYQPSLGVEPTEVPLKGELPNKMSEGQIEMISLFCHSPVFPIINIFYKGGILGNTAFAHLILAISLL